MREFIINENDSDQRVDKFLQKTLHELPKSLMYKYIRNKKIKVNKKRCEISQRLQVGDVVTCYIAEEFFVSKEVNFFHASEMLDVIYEDKNILIVNKEVGLKAHSDIAEDEDTLLQRVQLYLYRNKEYDPKEEQSFAPALCHRIDRNTSGLVMAAKNASGLREVNELIKQRRIEKFYRLEVEGLIDEKEQTLIQYHKKLENNIADIRFKPTEGYDEVSLSYHVIKYMQDTTLLEVELHSGKSHQIRAQMASIHHPIVGDVKYGAKKRKKSYQRLEAFKLMFHIEDEQSPLFYLNNKIIQLSKPLS